MPTYTYDCPCLGDDKPIELNVKIAERDNQNCIFCYKPLKRMIDAPGAVYAPTAKGGLAT